MSRGTTTIRRERQRLLDEAGYAPGPKGVRFHLTMKTSNEEDVRLLAAVLQQQLAKVGIALDLRSYEFATFYSDVTRGAFQMYSLRWIGGNEQPDIFSYVFSTANFSPKGANRGHYSNPQAGCTAQRCGAERGDGPAAHRLRRGAADSGARSASDQPVVQKYSRGAQPAADPRGSYALRQLCLSGDGGAGEGLTQPDTNS